jgi:ABC-type polysaccharide/polyol phosphate export permease
MTTLYAKAAARQDLARSFKLMGLAGFFAWQDIHERYVRTMLGPLWIVLSTGIWLGAMGFVMGSVFHQELHDYLPYLACGLVVWTLISTSISEGATVLIGAKRIIVAFNLPIFIHFLRYVMRNVIIFLHNAVIILIVFLVFPHDLNITALLVIPGLLLNIVILLSGAVILSLLNIRYRDTHLVISNALQVLPYITPIFWRRDMLSHHTWIADLNPLYHMLEIVRAPALGVYPAELSWQVTCGLSVVLPFLAYAMYLRYRHRIIFWI